MSDNDTYTIDISNNTMYGDVYTSDTISTITLDQDYSNISIDTNSTITIDDTHWADCITWEQTEFKDTMPSVAKVEDMCKDYPALNKAYENFKTIYAMVHQDWKGKQDEEETPF